MRTRLCLSMLLLSLFGATITYGQGEKKPRTVADYQPRMLRELTTLLPETFRTALAERGVEGNKDLKQIVHGELFPSRVKVVYSGKQRPLLQDKQNLIVAWANRLGGMPEFIQRLTKQKCSSQKTVRTTGLLCEQSFWNTTGSRVMRWSYASSKWGTLKSAMLEPVVLVEQVIRQ